MATKNFVPRATGEGQLGTDSKKWDKHIAISGAYSYVSASSKGSFGSLFVGGNSELAGNLTLGGNITIGDADTDSLVITADLSSSIVPDADSTYNIGSTSKNWKYGYIEELASTNITASNDISASGNLFLSGNADIDGTSNFADTVTVQTGLSVQTNITASGNLSASNIFLGGSIGVGGVSQSKSIYTTYPGLYVRQLDTNGGPAGSQNILIGGNQDINPTNAKLKMYIADGTNDGVVVHRSNPKQVAHIEHVRHSCKAPAFFIAHQAHSMHRPVNVDFVMVEVHPLITLCKSQG